MKRIGAFALDVLSGAWLLGQAAVALPVMGVIYIIHGFRRVGGDQ